MLQGDLDYQRRRPCAGGAPQSMKRSTIARGRLTVRDRGFTGAVSPKRRLVWDASRHHCLLRLASVSSASQHVEENLDGLASSLEVQISAQR